MLNKKEQKSPLGQKKTNSPPVFLRFTILIELFTKKSNHFRNFTHNFQQKLHQLCKIYYFYSLF